ncbi:MAG TPA: hypothetical protein VFV67_00865 [Actinophytocola sp.]|uniref:hypothetical protein n=1 Tax=Actinophytocola sp. TaxID=1872138 RepID=UPI002DBBB5CE|nr:hypothetical protein [Actinophytocola sp.]HEU5469174.1 hypothetical protein [Actinophytocola sp.]
MRRLLTVVVTAAAVSLPLVGGAGTAVAGSEKGPFGSLASCQIAKNQNPGPDGRCHQHKGAKGWYFTV